MRLAPFLIVIACALLVLLGCGDNENQKQSEPITNPIESPGSDRQNNTPLPEREAVPPPKSQMDKKKDSLIALKPKTA